MGKQNYFDTMNIFDSGVILSERDIDIIIESPVKSKYFLVAHIVNENIIDGSSKEYIESENDKKSVETTYEKTYLLTIDFQIYDLDQKKQVWSNVIYNRADRTESRTTRTGCFESCVDNLIDNIIMGSPAEISREEVFAKMIEKFVENLAESKRG
jgi:formate dehydrogenase assembly factor FdhD